jgi:hypothetical protein
MATCVLQAKIQLSYDTFLHDRVRLYWEGEALRQACGGGVRTLRNIGLFYLLEEMLRRSTLRILLRRSRDSFVPEQC